MSSPESKGYLPGSVTTKKPNNGRLFQLCIFACVSVYLASVFVTVTKRNGHSETKNLNSNGVPGFCASTEAIPVAAPHRNLWKNFNTEEATTIRNWLWAGKQNLNLTQETMATDFDNSIQLIEIHAPPKAYALAYINHGKPVPDRYAKIVINHGASNPPFIGEYIFGPLPTPLSSITLELANPVLTRSSGVYHRPDIPYNARMFPLNPSAYSQFIAKSFGPIQDIIEDLLGGKIIPDAPEMQPDLLVGLNTPLSYDGSWRRSWVQFRKNGPGSFLKPLDMYFYTDLAASNESDWHVIKMVYNKQIFETISDFANAYRNGTLIRSPHPSTDEKVEGEDQWPTRARRGPSRDLDERAGPRTVMFNGPRYRADTDEGFVSWMGWSFFTSFQRDMGLHIWDINFSGERIIYELSPQEALAVYSGNNPHQGSTVFLDRAFGMGLSTRSLILGYDCPADSLLLPGTVHSGMSSTRPDAICVFERDSGKPLSRHTGYLKGEMGAVKGYELVLRTISTVGNYDYLFDYTFQLDGTMEIRVSASGYLQGGWWDGGEHDYGTRIRSTYMGSLHDHVINFKVDFDINGTSNSLTAITLENEIANEDWFADDWGSQVNQQKIVRKILKTEDEGLLNYPDNYEGMFVVTNQDVRNRWGYPRGYGIHPGVSNIHMTNLNSKRTEKNVNFAKQHLAVSRRKENEPSSSSMWNINLPGDPPVNFFNFFDGESIEQEDLVLWINLGMHHIPRAEDSPMTLTNIATSNVLLTPVNFNDYDVSIDSLNAIVVKVPEPGEQWGADENEVQSNYCLPPKLPKFAYEGLQWFEEDGKPGQPATILEMRKVAESYHAIYADQL